MIDQKFISEAEKSLNIVRLKQLVPLLPRMQEFILGNAFARFPSDSILYKKTIVDFVESVVNIEVLTLQANNFNLLRTDVLVRNQVSMRLLLLGWCYERGFDLDMPSRKAVALYCAQNIDFKNVNVTV